jgi:general secretion pathway protein C
LLNTLNRKYAINLLTLLLVLLLAWLIGKLFWLVYSNSQPELVVPTLQSPINQGSSASHQVLSPVFLFGHPQNIKEQPKVVEQNLQKTRLNLKLLGVLVLPNNGVAIIEKSSKSHSYSLDEEIQKGVVLKEVHPDYVVINHNGVLEKLKMVSDEALFSQEDNQATHTLSAKQLDVLKSVKNNAQTNPVSILRYVRFKMGNDKGKQTIKVWPRKQKEIFKALGFQSGDEITIVNGYTVSELAKSPNIWQGLLKESSLDLTLIRNDQVQSISVQLD